MAQMAKNPLAKQETWVRSLGREHLEKGKVIYSSILAWRISWTEEPGRQQSVGSQSWTQLSNSHTHTHTDGKHISGCQELGWWGIGKK